MASTISTSSIAVLLAANVALTVVAVETHGQWPQWGGPNRDFKIDASGLSNKWPDEGPPPDVLSARKHASNHTRRADVEVLLLRREPTGLGQTNQQPQDLDPAIPPREQLPLVRAVGYFHRQLKTLDGAVRQALPKNEPLALREVADLLQKSPRRVIPFTQDDRRRPISFSPGILASQTTSILAARKRAGIRFPGSLRDRIAPWSGRVGVTRGQTGRSRLN
jgi:hypothetical protein